MSKALVLYLHIHQPFRIRQYSVFDIGEEHGYFDGLLESQLNNEVIFNKVAEKSYYPMLSLLQKIIDKEPKFHLSLSITGTFIDQAEQYAPDILNKIRNLVSSNRVEIVCETYYHSLAFFYSRKEFEEQVQLHREKIKSAFNYTPSCFRNTELAYNNEIASWAESAGYMSILAEGWERDLGWRSPNFVYQPEGTQKIRLLLKNYRLSDDIAFRFSDKSWSGWPLTAGKYIDWIKDSMGSAPLLNLFMDFETFGEHQWSDTGIFNFFEDFVTKWLANHENSFYTISKAAEVIPPVASLNFEQTTTWADSERDLSAWLGNNMQREAIQALYGLEHDVMMSGDSTLIKDWRRLQSSDHLYYMATKWLNDNDVHVYFSPYNSPYDAFLYFMNAVRDMRWRIMQYKGLDKFARTSDTPEHPGVV
jgi:alpha-amylase